MLIYSHFLFFSRCKNMISGDFKNRKQEKCSGLANSSPDYIDRPEFYKELYNSDKKRMQSDFPEPKVANDLIFILSNDEYLPKFNC